MINLPTAEMAETVAQTGNRRGAREDQFQRFDLAKKRSETVGAPGIAGCHACFEWRFYDEAMAENDYVFTVEVVYARARQSRSGPARCLTPGPVSFAPKAWCLTAKKVY